MEAAAAWLDPSDLKLRRNDSYGGIVCPDAEEWHQHAECLLESQLPHFYAAGNTAKAVIDAQTLLWAEQAKDLVRQPSIWKMIDCVVEALYSNGGVLNREQFLHALGEVP